MQIIEILIDQNLNIVTGNNRRRRRQTEFQNYRQTNFLELSETCLYMVHLVIGPFFRNRKKVST